MATSCTVRRPPTAACVARATLAGSSSATSGAVNVEIDVLGAVRRAIKDHESTAFEYAVDDALGQIGVMQHVGGGATRLEVQYLHGKRG